MSISDNQMAEFKKAFDASDTDGSGNIDASELSTVLGALGEDNDASSVADMLAEMDVDSDGVISFQEFVAMMSAKLDAVHGRTVSDVRRRASTMFVEADRTPVKTGYMLKRATSGKFRNWKRRYFLLRPDRIQYFVSEKAAEEGKVKGEVVFVHGAEVVEAPQMKPGCFKLQGAKDLYLVEPDETERTAWIEAIRTTIQKWSEGITKTLALLCGDDPVKATKHMMQGDNYMTVMQVKNGVSLSPIYVRMGSPVPVVFEWNWDQVDVTHITWMKRQIVGSGDDWEEVKFGEGEGVKPNQALVTMRPGNGYSFRFHKGDDAWLSPLQEVPSLLFKLRKVPLLGAVISSLPDEMQRKIDKLPEGKVKELLMKIANFMPLNPFDIDAMVKIEQGHFEDEEQQLTKGQKAFKMRDDKFSDPAFKFQLRCGYMQATITAVAKGFELVGLGFLGKFIQSSIDSLFMPSKAATREGLLKLEQEKNPDGTRKFANIEEMWAGKAEDYADELNFQHRHFLGGLKVKMPTPTDVIRAAASRVPFVQEGATLPVLFQWPGDAQDVKLMLCEMSGPMKEREAAELKAKTEAKEAWQETQIAVLKKKLGFVKAEEGEELKMTPFAYEKPARETLSKDWREVKLTKVKESSAPPPVGMEKAKKCKWAIELPLPTGDYCYKFVVDGRQMYKVTKALDKEDDGSYKIFHVQLMAAFGLGFDVGI